MHRNLEIEKLFAEDASPKAECNLCREAGCEIGGKTGYGQVIYRLGNGRNGWFATLSPRTGGDPESDFTIQLMPMAHLTHFSQIGLYPGLGENFGTSFSKICMAMASISMQEKGLKSSSDSKEHSASLGTYGKCTTWNEKKEHLHLKIFPFRGNIGQPYTVDSSFEKKKIFREKDGEEFVKMAPVRKAMIKEGRLEDLAKKIISLLAE